MHVKTKTNDRSVAKRLSSKYAHKYRCSFLAYSFIWISATEHFTTAQLNVSPPSHRSSVHCDINKTSEEYFLANITFLHCCFEWDWRNVNWRGNQMHSVHGGRVAKTLACNARGDGSRPTFSGIPEICNHLFLESIRSLAQRYALKALFGNAGDLTGKN